MSGDLKPTLEGFINQGKIIRFLYKNYKGDLSLRRVQPIRLYYGVTQYHPQEQWLLEGIDQDKNQTRHFAVQDILSFPVAIELGV